VKGNGARFHTGAKNARAGRSKMLGRRFGYLAQTRVVFAEKQNISIEMPTPHRTLPVMNASDLN
jgi:hypothetical protein